MATPHHMPSACASLLLSRQWSPVHAPLAPPPPPIKPPHLYLLCSSLPSSAMALKLAVFLFATALLVSTRVSSDAEELQIVDSAAALGYAKPPVAAPAPVEPQPGPRIIKDTKECGDACKDRCKLHSRLNVCSRACMTCCSVCKCVPPGTYGHTELCGDCYTKWKTHNNRTKCP